jgi:hypothetical protein
MNTTTITDAKLIEHIRVCARELPSEAGETAAMLQHYADEIESPLTREVMLKKFDEFAWHYKGLRDLIVPGVVQKDWEKLVKNISRDARAAIKARKPAAWWRRWF